VFARSSEAPPSNVSQLFRDHHAELYRYLVRLLGDADLAEDCAQDAFIGLQSLSAAPINARAWLFKVATNSALQARRTDARRRGILERVKDQLWFTRPAVQPGDAAVRHETREQLFDALARLNDRERTAILMREEGFAHREIAACFGTTTGSIGTIIARALEKLSRTLDLDGAEHA
jgi:RNA polymerase sigma factor (sigma-70 family)